MKTKITSNILEDMSRRLFGYKEENSKANQKNQPKNQPSTTENRKIITEKDIINLSPNHKLILPKGSIITHLAKDKAKEKSITIEIK